MHRFPSCAVVQIDSVDQYLGFIVSNISFIESLPTDVAVVYFVVVVCRDIYLGLVELL